MHIKKGDIVKVITGKYKGKEGKVLKVFPLAQRVIIEGVNMVKRHTRPSQQNPQGGIVEKEAAVHVSNVMLVVNGKPTRIGSRILKDGSRVRYAKKTGETVAEGK
ncbi:MAG: 50S ribosomal protein L24 [Candidatus Marinimicrobia bacterium]|nr:50S ribosomal protein L24 [Candidatus Neomarinimicrobiota bacterium]MDD4960683.1 50S ribosomal protein L24 [Candidatus Neomarinimicrobiota bacterium]MDD5709198.1 50S ribosomal protein L24 [Candidatus Neomarinimicrobiota bacterium]MDX9777933.1 50S ribosomal protein L24 [bacterium]